MRRFSLLVSPWLELNPNTALDKGLAIACFITTELSLESILVFKERMIGMSKWHNQDLQRIAHGIMFRYILSQIGKLMLRSKTYGSIQRLTTSDILNRFNFLISPHFIYEIILSFIFLEKLPDFNLT